MSNEPSEDVWNLHRDTIVSLYLIEKRKLEGVGGVMQEMLCKYDFKATKAQYEGRFRKWMSRKNKKSDTWKSTASCSAKRKRDGKETEVWDSCERISAKKLKKELARHGYDAAFSYGCQAPSPKTPEGLYICTPAALQADTSLLYNLPWFRFLDTIESRINAYPDLAAVAISMANKSVSNPVLSKPQNLEMAGYMPVILDKFTSALTPRATEASTSTLSNIVRPIHLRLRAMVPEDFDREPNAGHKGTSGLIKMDGSIQHFSLAVFLLTNSMVSTEQIPRMTGLFLYDRNLQHLKSLLAERSHQP